jgi:S-formylglutathione hydrolase FrmB
MTTVLRTNVLFAVVVLLASGGVARAADEVTFAGTSDVRVVSVDRIDARQYDVVIEPTALAREVHVRLLLPDGYAGRPDERFPVLYLFHGTSGRASDWVRLGDAVDTTAGLDLITVMPDAGFDGNGGGWFTDWVDRTTHLGPSQWETFHIGQLVPWVDANLRTIATREGRAVAGLSQGGFGSTTYPARHPDMFVSAASFSGAPDIDFNPLVAAGATAVIEATTVFLNGTAPQVMFGSRATNEINWQGHDPAQLADNLRTVDLWLFTASGANGPLDGLTPNPGGSAIEHLTYQSTMNFYVRALSLGVPVHMVDYHVGTHTWGYWARDLREYAGAMMYAFSHPLPRPSRGTYRSVEQSFTQWGWSVALDRTEAQAFTWLTGAGADGFTIAGTGTASVVTPSSYEPGSVHTVTWPGASQDLTADADGRLSIVVPLGTMPPPVVVGVPVEPAPNSTISVAIA